MSYVVVYLGDITSLDNKIGRRLVDTVTNRLYNARYERRFIECLERLDRGVHPFDRTQLVSGNGNNTSGATETGREQKGRMSLVRERGQEGGEGVEGVGMRCRSTGGRRFGPGGARCQGGVHAYCHRDRRERRVYERRERDERVEKERGKAEGMAGASVWSGSYHPPPHAHRGHPTQQHERPAPTLVIPHFSSGSATSTPATSWTWTIVYFYLHFLRRRQGQHQFIFYHHHHLVPLGIVLFRTPRERSGVISLSNSAQSGRACARCCAPVLRRHLALHLRLQLTRMFSAWESYIVIERVRNPLGPARIWYQK
ncbi:hypothetical protein B0H16DRAFT_1695665 [Mycena metata]|uniref:Uncharacterized protein n=1 Tax=Mycena metata TaxID=1033252 RepID=A0AAD7MW76_9AGAR|nr:hypothetical protein B0H16DRAFT_1695665 [Mycena metata]